MVLDKAKDYANKISGGIKAVSPKIWGGVKAGAPVVGGKLSTSAAFGAGMLGGVVSSGVIGNFSSFAYFFLAFAIHFFDVFTGVQRIASFNAITNIGAMAPPIVLIIALVVFIRTTRSVLSEDLSRILIGIMIIAIVLVLPFRDFMLVIYAVFIVLTWWFLSSGAAEELQALIFIGIVAYCAPLLNASLPSVSGGFDWRILFNPVLHPWFVYYGLFRFKDTKSVVKVVILGFLLFIWLGNLFFWTSTAPQFMEIRKTITEQDYSAIGEVTGQAKAGWASVWKGFAQSIQGMWQRKIAEAIGPFGVEEAKAEDTRPYGLEITESEFFTRKKFPTGSDVIIYATIKKLEGLERQDVKVTDVSCKLIDSENKEIAGEPSTTTFTLFANDKERDIKCTFKAANVIAGSYEAVFEAVYKSRSEATMQTCFMDLDKMQQLKRDGIEPITKCKMKTTSLVASHVYPVSLGIGLSRKEPIGLGELEKSEWCSYEPDLCEAPVLGIRAVIKQEWKTKVKSINSIIIQTPSGVNMETGALCDFATKESRTDFIKELTDQGYTAEEAEAYAQRTYDKGYVYDLTSANKGVEKDRSFFCKTNINRETVLGITATDREGAIAVPEQIMVVINYDLALKAEVKDIKVVEKEAK